MSRTPRWILAAFLLLFAWMILSGWETDSAGARIGSAAIAGLMVLGAAGAIAPRRMPWMLHVVAGAVALVYVAYFVDEVVRLLRGEHQRLWPGEPSAVMAGIGLIVFAIPLGIFAISGVRVGPFGARLRERSPTAEHDDSPPAI